MTNISREPPDPAILLVRPVQWHPCRGCGTLPPGLALGWKDERLWQLGARPGCPSSEPVRTMKGTRRPRNSRLFDRKRRRHSSGRRRSGDGAGKGRGWAGALVGWGVRNGLTMWGGILLFVAGFGLYAQVCRESSKFGRLDVVRVFALRESCLLRSEQRIGRRERGKGGC